MKQIIVLLLLAVSLVANIGNIMSIKGNAKVSRSNDMLMAKAGMQLIEGDKIITQVKSRVQVMLKDDTVVTIGASSSFGFEEFSFNGSSNSKVKMRANRGFFRSVTGKIGKLAPERFKVKTASATIGIRGTDFSGDINGGREVFKCNSGGIFVVFDGGITEVGAGDMITLSLGKVKVKKIPKVGDKKGSKRNQKSKKGSQNTQEDSSNKEDEVPLDEVVEIEADSAEIPTEDVADVTQDVDVHIDDEEPEQATPDEPFEMTPDSQDREEQY